MNPKHKYILFGKDNNTEFKYLDGKKVSINSQPHTLIGSDGMLGNNMCLESM